MTTAAELIANAKALLLDFDGPVTTLMPPPANAQAADQARAALAGIDLPTDIAESTDHLAVLRWTVHNATSRMGDVERVCTDAEVACARTSQPSPEIACLLEKATQRNLPLAIVSNNSEEAVRTFLDRFDWSERFAAYACRTPETVRLLKPNPFLVVAATHFLDVAPSTCVFIGDSVTDVQAGQGAAVKTIGLAKTSSRGSELAKAGAHAVIVR
jgi:beta-phosphoglucomutase-like phosphatase (HAD superfamily)